MYIPTKGRGKDHLVTIYIPVTPIPCPRPRVSKRGFVYYPASYNTYKDAAKQHVPELEEVWEFPLAAHFDFVIEKPKSTKFDYPVRGDIDNFTKTACDLITSVPGYWADDRQLAVMTARKRWAKSKEDAHTLIEIYSHEP